MKNRKKTWAKDFKLTIIVSSLVAIIFTFQTINLRKYSKEQKEEIAKIKTNINKENVRKTEIEKDKQYVGSDEYIKKIGRDTLGLIEDNEIILKPER